MKTKSTFLKKAIPAVLIVAGSAGLSSQANASAYAISYNNIFGLNVTSSPAVELGEFTSFSATSKAGATLNGVGTTASDQQGGPADVGLMFGIGNVYPGAAPQNNDMTKQGGGPGAQYGYADSQISQTALARNEGQGGVCGPFVCLNDPSTQAWQIAESYVDDEGFATGNSGVSSQTGFDSTFTLQQATSFTFAFNADPYMETAISSDAAGYLAEATLNVSITITNQDTGAVVFQWNPDGIEGNDITGGTETDDAFTLNTVNSLNDPDSSSIVDGGGNGAPTGDMSPGSYGYFSAFTDTLAAGTYSIALSSITTTTVETARAVPAPGILALMGLGLAGLGFSRRRKA